MQRKVSKVVALSLAAITMLSGCTQVHSDMQSYTVESNKISGNFQMSPDGSAVVNLSPSDIQKLDLVTKDNLNENTAANEATVQGDTNNEVLGAVYDYVSNNVKVDTSNLIPLTEAEEQLIKEHLDASLSCLKGADNKAMPDAFVNYILWELSRTQKQWDVERDSSGTPTSYEILGIDPATRKVFLDISFYSTDDKKLEIPMSKIIKGSYTENNSKALRQEQYLAYLEAKVYADQLQSGEATTGSIFGDAATGASTKESATAKASSLKTAFEKTWGSIESVLFEQQELSIAERLRYYINNTDKLMSLEFTEAYKKHLLETGFTDKDIRALDDMSKYKTPSDFLAHLEADCGFNTTKLNQVDLSKLDRKYLQSPAIGTYTYTGITGQTLFPASSKNPAKATFRFIFDFDYDLTTQASVKTTSVYLKDYSLLGYESIIKDYMKIDDDKAISIPVVTPYLDYTIYSYQRCIEEDNLIGLYSLFGSAAARDEYTGEITSTSSRFQDWDKYYSDWMRYCYTKFNAYDYEIVGWNNDVIQLLVHRSKKIRGKGTQMTFPTYNENVLIELAVENDNVYIKSETLLSSSLVGEPLSMIRDVTGVADKIAFDSTAFSETSEKGVLLALQHFSKYQLDYMQQAFSTATKPQLEFSYTTPGAISYGVAASTLETIKLNMSSAITDKTKQMPTEKITYLGTWATKSNVYCRVRVREIFMLPDGSTANTESYVGLVNRDGVWVVVSYERANTAKGTPPTSDKGCLAHDYLDGRPSTTRYKESAQEAERGMGEGTAIDYTNFTAGGDGSGSVGTKPQTPATTTSNTSTSTTAPVEIDTPPTSEGTSTTEANIPTAEMTTSSTEIDTSTAEAPVTSVPEGTITGNTDTESTPDESVADIPGLDNPFGN